MLKILDFSNKKDSNEMAIKEKLMFIHQFCEVLILRKKGIKETIVSLRMK